MLPFILHKCFYFFFGNLPLPDVPGMDIGIEEIVLKSPSVDDGTGFSNEITTCPHNNKNHAFLNPATEQITLHHQNKK